MNIELFNLIEVNNMSSQVMLIFWGFWYSYTFGRPQQLSETRVVGRKYCSFFRKEPSRFKSLLYHATPRVPDCPRESSVFFSFKLSFFRRMHEREKVPSPLFSRGKASLKIAFMRERPRQRLVFDGIYLRHLAAARKYVRSLWSTKKLRRHS